MLSDGTDSVDASWDGSQRLRPRWSQRRSLGRNVIWTLSGNTGLAISQWLMLVVVAKLGQPAQVGQYALALGLTAPVMLLASLNLRAVQSTDIRNDHPFVSYLRLRLCTTVVALVVCLAIARVASLSTGTALVVGFVALAKASESVSDVFYGRLQQREQMDRIAISMVARGVLSLLAMTIMMWTTGSVVWGACGVLLSWLAMLVIYDIQTAGDGPGTIALHRELAGGWGWHGLRALLPLAWLAAPLGGVQMLISLNTNIPRFFIQAVAGEYELGIYAAIAYVTMAGSTFVAAIGQAASPRLARLFADGDRAGFIRLLQRLVAFFLASCVVAIAIVLVAGDALLSYLYTPAYAAHASLLLLFTISFGVGAIVSVCGFGITAARRFRPQVPVVAVAVLAVTAASAVLVPRFGILGAAWAVLISLIVWAFGAGWVLRSVLTDVRASAGRADVRPVGMEATKP